MKFISFMRLTLYSNFVLLNAWLCNSISVIFWVEVKEADIVCYEDIRLEDDLVLVCMRCYDNDVSFQLILRPHLPTVFEVLLVITC